MVDDSDNDDKGIDDQERDDDDSGADRAQRVRLTLYVILLLEH